jgi:hypothetical protein
VQLVLQSGSNTVANLEVQSIYQLRGNDRERNIENGVRDKNAD